MLLPAEAVLTRQEIRESVLGPEHPDTAITYHNLANVYLDARDLDNAVRYSDRALAVFQRVLGEAHPYTVDTKSFNGFLHMLSALHDEVGDSVWDILEEKNAGEPEPPAE